MKKIDYKKWTIAFLLFVVAVLIGYIFTIMSPVSSSPQGTSVGSGMDMDMMLKTFNVQRGQPIPTVSLSIQKEPDANEWDVHIVTTNFVFRPEKVGQKAVLGEGHIHLFVDGKLYVVLSPWFHIDTLPKGKHIILVRVANNDHSTYAVNGKYIQVSHMITAP